MGKASRDFERYPEEARKVDASHCFIVVYGLEFRLKTLSLAGQCSQRGAVASLNLHHSCVSLALVCVGSVSAYSSIKASLV